MVLIIGSTAMNYWFSDAREPKDYDYFADPEGHVSPWIKNNSQADPFWDNSWRGTRLDEPFMNRMATPDELYTIKMSHSYWELKNGSWSKHMADIVFLKRHGAKLDMALHNILYPVWVKTHGAKKMNLAQAAGNFFDDAVVRIYDHDSIHESCAFGDKPLYEAILKDGETVDIDPTKLWNMPFDTQVKLFREEIAATALERWMIPSKYRVSPGLAYTLALRKTIVSLTKGRSARFIVDNFEHFMKPHDYMSIHREKIDKLKPLDKTKKGMM